MSSRSSKEILIKSTTELFDLVFAAYNLSFISPRVVCLLLYAKGQCTRFQQRALFTVLYSLFKHCAKDVSTFTAQPTILEYYINTKLQLPTPYGFGDIAQTRFQRLRSLLHGQR